MLPETPARPSPQGQWLESRTALALAVAIPLLLAAAVLARLPREVFWITDGGNKLIQVQDLDRSGATDFAIDYPARPLDPELRFFPWGGHHFQNLDGRILSFYPPWFPLLSLPGYRLLGFAGLHLLPWLGLGLALAAFAGLLGAVGLGAWRTPATLAFALGTPLFFYGLTFWEHTPAVALSTAALLVLLRGSAGGEGPASLWIAGAAGLLLGLSTALREEGYALAAAAVLAVLIAWRRIAPALGLAMGWSLAMAPVWWFQQRLYGSPLGLHLAAYGGLSQERGPTRLLSELGDLGFYLFRFHPDLRLCAVLVVPFVLLAAAGLVRREGAGRAEAPLLWLAAAGAALLVAFLAANPEPVFNTLWTQGLLPHTPLLLLALARGRSLLGSPRPAVRLLAWTCLLYVPIVCLPLHRADVGILWGPRHFLPVYPALFALALVALAAIAALGEPSPRPGPAAGPSAGTAVAAAAVLFLLGVAVEVHGLRLLALKEGASRRILEAVRAAPARVVVTDAYWLPEELAALWSERAFLFVGSDDDYRELMRRLAAAGVDRVTVVLARRYGALARPSLLDLRGRALDARPVSTPGAGFLDVMVLSCRARPV